MPLQQYCPLGSPPPTRGTRLVQVSEKGGERITPAYAGNTSISSMLLNLLGDHPRLRGEHADKNNASLQLVGSPPPTRGTLVHPWLDGETNGITPAYAGNTTLINQGFRGQQDHPRLRGEHQQFLGIYDSILGSPPPTRGTLLI